MKIKDPRGITRVLHSSAEQMVRGMMLLGLDCCDTCGEWFKVGAVDAWMEPSGTWVCLHCLGDYMDESLHYGLYDEQLESELASLTRWVLRTGAYRKAPKVWERLVATHPSLPGRLRGISR